MWGLVADNGGARRGRHAWSFAGIILGVGSAGRGG